MDFDGFQYDDRMYRGGGGEERTRRRRNDPLEFRTTRNGKPVSRVLSRVTHFQRVLAVINIQRLYRGYRVRKWYRRAISRPERNTPPSLSSRISKNCSHCRLLVSSRYCIDCKGFLCDSCFVLIHPSHTRHRWHAHGSRVVRVGRSPSPSGRRRISPKMMITPSQQPRLRKKKMKKSIHSPTQRRHHRAEEENSSLPLITRHHQEVSRNRVKERILRYQEPSQRHHVRWKEKRRSPSSSSSSSHINNNHDDEIVVMERSKESSRHKIVPKIRVKPKITGRKRDDTDADSTSSSECSMATAQSIGHVRDVIKRLRRFRLEREERKRFRQRRRQERRDHAEKKTSPEVVTQSDIERSSPQRSLQEEEEERMSIKENNNVKADPAVQKFLKSHGISESVGRTLARHDIDFELLTDLADSEMREIGLTLGVRKRLRRALISISLSRDVSAPSPAVQNNHNSTRMKSRYHHHHNSALLERGATLKIQSICRGFIARMRVRVFRFVSFGDAVLKRRKVANYFELWKVNTERVRKYEAQQEHLRKAAERLRNVLVSVQNSNEEDAHREEEEEKEEEEIYPPVTATGTIRRVDFTDGHAYTKEEFLEHYGNLEAWHDAFAPDVEAVDREHELMSPVKSLRHASPKIRHDCSSDVSKSKKQPFISPQKEFPPRYTVDSEENVMSPVRASSSRSKSVMTNHWNIVSKSTKQQFVSPQKELPRYAIDSEENVMSPVRAPSRFKNATPMMKNSSIVSKTTTTESRVSPQSTYYECDLVPAPNMLTPLKRSIPVMPPRSIQKPSHRSYSESKRSSMSALRPVPRVMIQRKIVQRKYARRVGATKFQTVYRAYVARRKFALLRLSFRIARNFNSLLMRQYLHVWNTTSAELKLLEEQRSYRLSQVQSFAENRFKYLATQRWREYVDNFVGQRHDVVVQGTAEVLQDVMKYADALEEDHAAVSVRIRALEVADDARQATKEYLEAKREYEEAQLMEDEEYVENQDPYYEEDYVQNQYAPQYKEERNGNVQSQEYYQDYVVDEHSKQYVEDHYKEQYVRQYEEPKNDHVENEEYYHGDENVEQYFEDHKEQYVGQYEEKQKNDNNHDHNVKENVAEQEKYVKEQYVGQYEEEQKNVDSEVYYHHQKEEEYARDESADQHIEDHKVQYVGQYEEEKNGDNHDSVKKENTAEQKKYVKEQHDEEENYHDNVEENTAEKKKYVEEQYNEEENYHDNVEENTAEQKKYVKEQHDEEENYHDNVDSENYYHQQEENYDHDKNAEQYVEYHKEQYVGQYVEEEKNNYHNSVEENVADQEKYVKEKNNDNVGSEDYYHQQEEDYGRDEKVAQTVENPKEYIVDENVTEEQKKYVEGKHTDEQYEEDNVKSEEYYYQEEEQNHVEEEQYVQEHKEQHTDGQYEEDNVAYCHQEEEQQEEYVEDQHVEHYEEEEEEKKNDYHEDVAEQKEFVEEHTGHYEEKNEYYQQEYSMYNNDTEKEEQGHVVEEMQQHHEYYQEQEENHEYYDQQKNENETPQEKYVEEIENNDDEYYYKEGVSNVDQEAQYQDVAGVAEGKEEDEAKESAALKIQSLRRGFLARKRASSIREEERRMDPTDGKLYTKEEFMEHYGNLESWNNAQSSDENKSNKDTVWTSSHENSVTQYEHHYEDIEDQRGYVNSSSSSSEEDEEEEELYISERPPLDPRHKTTTKAFLLSDRVMATFEKGEERKSGTIVAINADGTYDILFDNGDKEASIHRSRIFSKGSSPSFEETNGYYSARQDHTRRLSARSGTSSMTASSLEVTNFQQSLNHHFGTTS